MIGAWRAGIIVEDPRHPGEYGVVVDAINGTPQGFDITEHWAVPVYWPSIEGGRVLSVSTFVQAWRLRIVYDPWAAG